MADRVQALMVKDPSGAERMVPLDRDVLTVGRDTGSTIRIDSPYVSRQHARIELGDSGPVLVHLSTTNKSYINGDEVEGSTALNAGDVISIADATIECIADATPDGTTRTYEKPSNVGRKPQTPPDAMRVDAQAYEVWIGETLLERRLSAQEFDLLRFLYEHQDRVCTSQELGDAIWGSGNWDKDMLHRLVHRLKRKVEPNPDKPRYVQTIPWVGYRVTP
ncbi:MAG: winged helix-turn-helix domain-containing protein [Chloroflexi bacterium]|nr:winged helix-turn-helix domain-containing protein [Chloroflexota bacterium]